jgi:hypothetical protein
MPHGTIQLGRMTALTAQEMLKEALAGIVAPAMRSAGFKGSGKNWRRFNNLGDVAMVNVQSSAWSTQDEVRCVINLAMSPRPYLAWFAHRCHMEIPKNPGHTWGIYRDRLDASEPGADRETWWTIGTPSEAETTARDMARKLATEGIPALSALLDRQRLLQTLREGRSGFGKESWLKRCEALLLADNGPSPELDRILDDLSGRAPGERKPPDDFETWIRAQLP